MEGNDPSNAKPNKQFIEQMNDFCSSMGDCGSSVNYVGTQPGGKGYSATTGEQNNPLSRLGSLGNLEGIDFTERFTLGSLLKMDDANYEGGFYINANDSLNAFQAGGFKNMI